MSLRLEMLQAARLAPRVLGGSAALVQDFLLRQQNVDGGFKDRAGKSDLYYTVFGLDALSALESTNSGGTIQGRPGALETKTAGAAAAGSKGAGEPKLREAAERAARFAGALGAGEGLDFVHLCCLARAIAQASASLAPGSGSGVVTDTILRRIEAFRSKEGGYHATAGSRAGTVYGCFLALGAYQDVRRELPRPEGLVHCLDRLKTPDGAWTNADPGSLNFESRPAAGSTNATAAALAVLRQLAQPAPASAADWLLARVHSQGGFLASPDAPLPDLLSTATALHALAGLQAPLEAVRERCLDFVDSLWTNEGSFHAHWAEETLDCEYTFYGLLALGHLS